MQPVNVVLVGAGQRGRYVYGAHSREHPEELRIVAVVEPDPVRRERLADLVGVAPSGQHAALDEALQTPADAWIVASPDAHHHAAARAALDAGIPVLLEKPMAASIADTSDLVARAEASGTTLAVAHVLRHTPFFTAVHDIVAGGHLGDIVTVEHRENVVAWHMAHSYVRGNWSRTGEATPMIVAKCCHDFDILTWNLATPVRALTSVGSLFHFHPDRAPPGATPRCTDPCPVADCPFDARRVYLDETSTGWPVHVITDDLSAEGRLTALRHGPYGRCVYTAGSNAVDHQIVTMELEDGASAVLVMHGHSHEEARTMRYDGTRATLRGVFGRRPRIEVIDHRTGTVTDVPVPATSGGHGGGDRRIISAFVDAVRGGTPPLTSGAESLESHLLAFAAEEARTTGERVLMTEYRSRYAG